MLVLPATTISAYAAPTAPGETVPHASIGAPGAQSRTPPGENPATPAPGSSVPSDDPTSSVSVVSQSVPSSATASSPERKVLFAGGYWWVFWDDDGALTYSSSTDGVTWSAPVQPAGFSSELSFSVWASAGTFYYAASNGAANTGGTGDFYYDIGTLNSGGTISWATESTVPTQYPTQDSISVITDSLGDPWVAAYTEQGGAGVGDQYAEAYELTGGSWSLTNTILGRSIGPEFGYGWVQIVPLPEQSPTVPNVAVLFSFNDCTECFTGTLIEWTMGLSDGVWSWSSPFYVDHFEETDDSYAQFSATAIGDTVYVAGSAASGGVYFSDYVIGETDLPSAPVMIAAGQSWYTSNPTEVSISQGAAGSNTLVIFYNAAGPNVDYSVSTDLGAAGTWDSSQSIFSNPQTEIMAISSADSASSSGELGVVFINYEEVFNLDFATVTISPTGTQITAPLQDAVDVTGAPVPPATAPLSDAVNVIDQYVAPAEAPLADAVNLVDKYVSSIKAPLADAVNLADSYVQSTKAPLDDIVGFGEALMASLGLPTVKLATLVFHDPPGYFLVTPPGDTGTVGCEADGSAHDDFSSSVATVACSPSEVVTIYNPSPGGYEITPTGTPPVSVTVQAFDSSGAGIGTPQTYSVSTPIYSDLAADGTVTFSSSPPPSLGVPEFPGSFILVVTAILFLSLTYRRVRSQRFDSPVKRLETFPSWTPGRIGWLCPRLS